MADLKIRVFKGREAAPETTVTVPGSVLKIASKLVPRRAREALQERGIDLARVSHHASATSAQPPASPDRVLVRVLNRPQACLRARACGPARIYGRLRALATIPGEQRGLEIIKLAENPEARGTLVEVEEHKKNERIVIALE